MEFVRRLNRSLNTRKVQRALDSSPLVLYYTVNGMTAQSYTNLKRLLFDNGFECHLMCRNKCLPVHEDDLHLIEKSEQSKAAESVDQKTERPLA